VSALPAHPRVLVTGGAGFIGSHLVERLLAAGGRVMVVDDLSTGRASNLDAARAAHGDRLEFVHSPVAEAMPRLAGRPFDAVYHLAAAVGVRLVIESPAASAERNVADTAEVLRFASRAGAATLIASSSEVYGKGVRSPFREEDDISFGPPTVARWSYGLSKAIDEHLAIAHAATTGLPTVVTRFFNTVGPRQRARWGMVLPRFVDAALAGRPLEVHGSGAQVRCFCDVRDVVGALPALLARAGRGHAVFNVGTDVPISIIDLARLVVRTLASPSPIVTVPYDRAFGPGFEDLEVRIPDVTRVREAIGFRPAIALADTVRDLAAERARGAEAAA
jgi:UDP-glucose 4-epimerase